MSENPREQNGRLPGRVARSNGLPEEPPQPGGTILVTGGAGYIGSVVAAQLVAAGHDVTVLDDLSTGFADAVPPGATFVKGPLRDCAAEVLADDIEAVLHFAAKSLVGESVANPARYWSNNLGGTISLLEAMREIGVRTIVFSSTAAVYGEPERTPILETDPTRPTSPYGASKIAVDTTLTEFCRLHGFGAVSLRYFNVAGAFQGTDGRWLGERHHPHEAHGDDEEQAEPEHPRGEEPQGGTAPAHAAIRSSPTPTPLRSRRPRRPRGSAATRIPS